MFIFRVALKTAPLISAMSFSFENFFRHHNDVSFSEGGMGFKVSLLSP